MPRQGQPPLETGTSCEASTRSELGRLRLVDSPEGQACLALAAAIDSGRSLMAVPAMVTALTKTLDDLRGRVPQVKDTTDEFSERRRARRAAAGL